MILELSFIKNSILPKQNFTLIIKQQMNHPKSLQKNQTLPSLRNLKNPHNTSITKPQKSISTIQSKLKSHDSQLIQNQRTIFQLSTQFKKIKERLRFEQQYNEKTKSYSSRLIKDNQILNKREKQLKSIVNRHQNNLRKLMNQKKNHDSVVQKKDEQIEELKKLLSTVEQKLKKCEELIKVFKRKQQNHEEDVQKHIIDYIFRQERVKRQLQQTTSSKNKRIAELQLQIQQKLLFISNYTQEISKLKYDLQKKQQKIKQLLEQINKSSSMQKNSSNLQTQISLKDKQILDLQKSVQKLEEKLKSYEAKEQKIQSIKDQKSKNLMGQNKELNIRIDRLVKESDQLKKYKEKTQMQRKAYQQAQSQWKQEIKKYQQFHVQMKKSKGTLQSYLNQLKQLTICQFCKKLLKNPVTNIPCGHSYCKDCKKGYEKQCIKCPGSKREAVYRNQLMDDIVGAWNAIENVLKLLI